MKSSMERLFSYCQKTQTEKHITLPLKSLEIFLARVCLDKCSLKYFQDQFSLENIILFKYTTHGINK